MTTSKDKVQSVERALQILECFSSDKPELLLGEIAKKTQLSKSTVFRLLTTLADHGYIKQNPENQKYSLGIRFFHLGSVVVNNISIRQAALPFMKALCEEISETVALNIIDEDSRVCIETVESPEIIRNFVKVGQRVHLTFGCSGRLMLAYMPEAERTRIIAEGLKMDANDFDEEKLLADIELFRNQGYGLSINDRITGAFSIAAPIFDHTKQIVGCINVAGPTQRLSDDRLPTLIQRVCEYSYQISLALGYTGKQHFHLAIL